MNPETRARSSSVRRAAIPAAVITALLTFWLPGHAQGQEGHAAGLLDRARSLLTSQTGAGSGTQTSADTSALLAGEDADVIVAQPAESTEPPDITVTTEGRVRMHARSQDIGLVLQMLSVESQRNIVASQNVSGTVTANLYDVTFDEALTAILDGVDCAWQERGNFIYVYTNHELIEMAAAQRQRISRLFRLHYTRAADIQTMIQPMLSEAGTVSITPGAKVGISTSSDDAGGDSLSINDCILVVDYAENIGAIARLIEDMDVRPQQVLIEATIIRARLSEDNALGIDFDFVGGIDFATLGATSPDISIAQQGGAGTTLNTGALPPGQFENTTVAVGTDLRSGVPSGGFTMGVIRNSVGVFIRALEEVTDATVLANPKILALNKQRGEVIIGQRIGYRGGVQTTTTSTTETVEFLETGTRLVFRPYIAGDGYIRMEIHPEDSSGTLTASDLPLQDTTELTTGIMVRDGNTILIGGLFREVTTASRGQIPLLGDVPGVGSLFRNTRDITQREEIIILLTVHLIKDDAALAEASAAARDDVERLRVGMREGLQWFGRQRLAHAHYEWALDHMQRGHLNKAVWDLNLALNNNPKFLAAITLREELMDKRHWVEDDSSVRGLLMRQINREHGIQAPLFNRPGPPFDLEGVARPTGSNGEMEVEPQTGAGGSDTKLAPSLEPAGEGDS